MNKEKSKKPSWINVKNSIKSFESSQFIDLLKNLYQLSEENKTFLHARFLKGDDSLKRYKKVILKCLYPDFIDEKDDFDFDRADRAIADYAKATADDEGTADLMIYYVECGNKFTLDYGDIDEYFYDTLVGMYEKAIQKVRKFPNKKQGAFRERLEKIMKSSDGIGWGYHDGLCDSYYEAFE